MCVSRILEKRITAFGKADHGYWKRIWMCVSRILEILRGDVQHGFGKCCRCGLAEVSRGLKFGWSTAWGARELSACIKPALNEVGGLFWRSSEVTVAPPKKLTFDDETFRDDDAEVAVVDAITVRAIDDVHPALFARAFLE